MLSNQEVVQYLSRMKSPIEVGIREEMSLAEKLALLTKLHIAHMENIPFENLDIPLGNEISLLLPAIFKKVVLQNRGGFCYELNYLFSTLLKACGFNVSLLSAQIFDGDTLGKKFDHMLVLVELENENFIADVGFGDSFVAPLALNGTAVKQNTNRYKVLKNINDEQYLLWQKKPQKEWQAQYAFSLTKYSIDAFNGMCKYQQSSALSTFTKKSVCSIATKTGRKTIANGRFIETINGDKSEYAIDGRMQYQQLLKQHFNFNLPSDTSLAVWRKLKVNLA